MPHVAVKRSGRISSTALLAALCAALLLTGGSKPAGKTTQSSRVASNEPVAAGETQPSDIHHLAVWIDAARETFNRVRDYQCTFSKCERVDGAPPLGAVVGLDREHAGGEIQRLGGVGALQAPGDELVAPGRVGVGGAGSGAAQRGTGPLASGSRTP